MRLPLNLLRPGWLRVLIAAELTFALLVAGGLWLLRQQALEAETRMLEALADAMARQADRTLDLGEVVLSTTTDELSRGIVTPTGPEITALLRERVRLLPGYRALSLFGPDGQRLATSREMSAALPASVADRDFFAAAQQAGPPRLFLSQPYVAAGDGQPALSLSLGWRDAAGRFAGVAVLVADPDFLAGGPARLARDREVQQALLRPSPDGRTLVPLAPGQAAAVPEGLRQALQPVLDGRPTRNAHLALAPQHLVVATAALQQSALLQAVWRDEDSVLSSWNELAWLVGAFVAAMLGVTLAVGLRMAREQLRVDALQQRLTRSRKLEALGQLAGGVAHDFNNVLSALVGFGEMARQAAAEGSAQARHLDRVLQAAERGRQQVERIMAFSRGQPRRSVSFRLQPLVQEVLDHLGSSTPVTVQVSATLTAADTAVRGDPTATYEAVMNLCTNALQAMPGGGALTVRLAEVMQPAPRQTYDAVLPVGRYLCLQVQDSGQGMSPEVLARLFEPFFTTKGRQGGSGIGLAVVHGVVRDLGGAIDVDSTPGRGSQFTLWLPVCTDPPEADTGEAGALPQGRGQTVLVVDDDPALVELAEDLLATLGYEPRGTTSAEAALQALQDAPAEFDLLITDEVMPGMTGTALARAARSLRPDLPIVLCSGYGGEDFAARAMAAGVDLVLTKPLTTRALALGLQRVLHPSLQP